MSALLVPQFIVEEERVELAQTAMEYLERGILERNKSGVKRHRKKVFNTQYCTPLISALGKRIASHMGIEQCPVDPYLGWIISVIQPGGFIQPHRDAHQHYQLTGDKHLRCNLLVQGSHPSTKPRIGKLHLRASEGDLWAFFASDHIHGTDVIEGNQNRIVYQFGFVVPKEYPLADVAGQWIMI